MSSSKDALDPEDFENLIAAVDSLEIPEDVPAPTSNLTAAAENLSNTINNTRNSTENPLSADTTFTAEDELFDQAAIELSEEENEFAELDNLSSSFSELNFDEEPEPTPVMSLSLENNDSTNNKQIPGETVSKFTVDDPFTQDSPQVVNSVPPATEANFIADAEETDDEFASLIEVVEESFGTAKNSEPADLELHNEFADFHSDSQQASKPAQTTNLFAINGEEDDEFADFDGIEAANEISNLFREDQDTTNQNSTTAARSNASQPNPLSDSITKTQQATEKLKSHLASLATKNNPQEKQQQQPQRQEPQRQEPPLHMQSNVDDLSSIETMALEDAFLDAPEVDSNIPEPAMPQATENQKSVFEKKIAESIDLEKNKAAREEINLRQTEEVSDELLAAFVESPLNEKTQSSRFSLNAFALKFPRVYFSLSLSLALLGFAYILAIPVLLGVALFNGFEMLNSPFTDNMIMLLAALFGISLFLFMAFYKLLDLKFTGPGGITLNNENAATIIEKIQKIKSEQSVPRIHEIVLTRRHELNLIKVPRFGLPIWSKNVLAIGYPLLQTLPVEYFDVALSRRLIQFSKRRNAVSNWLSFMRRTWTLYAVSLKERKGVIDLIHYCFFAPYASLYRKFAVYMSQNDELLADETALRTCNDRDLVKTAQTLRITRAMLIQYFWPKLNEELQGNMASPKYVQPYRKLPAALNSLLKAKNVDSWFIRLGQESVNPGDPEPPFKKRMECMGQRKVAVPPAFDTNAAQHYFNDKYDEMTEMLDTMWAEEVQKELFMEHLENESHETSLPCRLAIEPA